MFRKRLAPVEIRINGKIPEEYPHGRGVATGSLCWTGDGTWGLTLVQI